MNTDNNTNRGEPLSGLYIVNCFDCPCERMVAMKRESDGTFWYVSEVDNLRRNPHYFGMKSDRPTPIENFGITVQNGSDGTFQCVQEAESVATYDDGRRRKWQGQAVFTLPGGSPWEEPKVRDNEAPEELRLDGFSTKKPDRCGLWLIACNEMDYEPHYVAIYREVNGAFWVHDPSNASTSRWSMDQYHDGLTNPCWKISE